MFKPNVLVIEAGLGNLGSVCAAFERLGVRNIRYTTPPSLQDESTFTHLLLPGVGSFRAGMSALVQLGWDRWIYDNWLPSRRPMLGICLGMQLLASSGTEGGHKRVPVQGLNLIGGEVSRLTVKRNLVLPHVGWNSLTWRDPNLQLADGFPKDGDVYFVHSYAFSPSMKEHSLALSVYGGEFTAVVGDPRLNIWGMQFHPEKSQKLGRCLLQNFLALKPCSNDD